LEGVVRRVILNLPATINYIAYLNYDSERAQLVVKIQQVLNFKVLYLTQFLVLKFRFLF